LGDGRPRITRADRGIAAPVALATVAATVATVRPRRPPLADRGHDHRGRGHGLTPKALSSAPTSCQLLPHAARGRPRRRGGDHGHDRGAHGATRPPARANMCSVREAATILHADADSFFASVEQRDDPRLRGRPVIVAAGVVLAASYEAKAYGVRTAMGGALARRLCPGAVVVPPRMPAYVEASRALFEVFEDATPLVEGVSIDEAFLDARGLERIAGTPVEIARRLRRDVRERVGLPITVAVARTKF